MTLTILQMEIRLLPGFFTSLIDTLQAIYLALWIASICLIVCCDVVLTIDAVRTRRDSVPRRFRALGDCIVWISGVCFTVYAFWGARWVVRAYNHNHGLRFDIVSTALALALLALTFDTLLLIDAVKMLRAIAAQRVLS
jgi:hypothetical protein